jgi:putative hydrolase of the HAD superfamily
MEVRRSSTRVFMTPKPGVLDMLGELREIGWILGLITDCVYDVPAVWPESRFALHFSCVTHIRKPDSRAYLSFLDTLNVRPEDALFVGDGGSDGLNGAVRAGIDGLMIDDNPTPAEQMLKVGVGEWSGPVITSMSHLTSYARNRR